MRNNHACLSAILMMTISASVNAEVHSIDWREDKSTAGEYTVTFVAAKDMACAVWSSGDTTEAAYGLIPGDDGKAKMSDVAEKQVAAALEDAKEGDTYAFLAILDENVWKRSVEMLPEWKAAQPYPEILRGAQEFLVSAAEAAGLKPSYVSLLRPPAPVGFVKDLHNFNRKDKQ